MANLTKDQRIIKDNPGKSPYELLELGLSQKGYEELQAAQMQQQQQVKPQPQSGPLTPQIRQVQPAQPIVSAFVSNDTGVVNLRNAQTGNTKPISASIAKRLCEKQPKIYQIVP